jgi:hypothetical protein
MLHVAFDGFDEIRDQVVSASQLNVNLGKRVFDTVSKVNQAIIDTDCENYDCRDYREEYYE